MELRRRREENKEAIEVSQDIDWVSTKEEVKESLVREGNMEVEEFEIVNLEPAYGGNLLTVGKLPAGKVDSLIKIGAIRMGLSRCRVQRRV